MSLTVCKFGGSSVSDAGMFMRVNQILRDDPARKYIVLSAPGKRCSADEKITDLFYRAHEALQSGDTSILTHIFNRYASIRDALCPDFDLESEFIRLQQKLLASRDCAASRGEYLCAKLFAAYTKLPFVDAEEIIIFHSDGKVNVNATYTAIREKLMPLKKAVIPGFYGKDASGNIRTFSRGGSDVTGALLAAALQADLYENWTDVNGLFTADPCIVADARRNSMISLKQMEQIATAGAKLLHPDALKPLYGSKIETVLKNTFSPGEPGTRICEDYDGHVFCVTGQRSLYVMGDFTGKSGDLPLLYTLPIPGSVQVSVVNVFGLKAGMLERLQSILSPIHIIHMQNHIQIIIPDKEYESTIRTVHKVASE